MRQKCFPECIFPLRQLIGLTGNCLQSATACCFQSYTSNHKKSGSFDHTSFVIEKPYWEQKRSDAVKYLLCRREWLLTAKGLKLETAGNYIAKVYGWFIFARIQAANIARFFFKTMNGSVLITEQLDRPRREHKLPNVLSKEEVAAILQALVNQKHRSMLSLIYAYGLRRGELLNLKPENVDSK